VTRASSGDRGVATVEMLMISPILVLVAMAVCQIAAIALAGSAAGDAALAAARANRLGVNPQVAATQAVGNWLRPVTISNSGGNAWTAHVTVPRLVPWVDVDVARTAELP
jgi:hypothetical protein